jgi:hypothetical protein
MMAAAGEELWSWAAAWDLSRGADGPVAVKLEQVVGCGN